jgi:hypothetical protein
VGCSSRHDESDPLLGAPLCGQCFDYRAAVLWNAHVPALWERTSSELYRAVARAGRVGTGDLRATVRLSYIKVVEFQRRGLVHLHVVIRADGREGPAEAPPAWLESAILIDAVKAAVGRAGVAIPSTEGMPSRRASWGAEHDVRVLIPSHDGDSTAIAAYVAKYATKTADGTPWLAHPIRSTGQLSRLDLRPHILRFVETAWALGQRKEYRSLRLRAHAHTLGYTGQFSSKSLRFSTTFGALRNARAFHVQGEQESRYDYDGAWRFAGRGYVHPEAHQVAESLRLASPKAPHPFHTTSTNRSTTP